MNNEEIILNLEKIFNEHKNEEIALKQKKYLLNQFEFFGIQTPLRRIVCLDLILLCSKFEINKILDLCFMLVNKDKREFLYFAQDLIYKVYKKLSCDDIKYIIKKFITNKPWWENCDGFLLSIYRWTELFPKYLSQISNFCLRYKNLWIRRCGILLQLHHKNFNKDVFDKVLLANIDNKDFFIQKAFGWFLRELGKKDFDLMLEYYNLYKNKFTRVANEQIVKQIKRQQQLKML